MARYRLAPQRKVTVKLNLEIQISCGLLINVGLSLSGKYNYDIGSGQNISYSKSSNNRVPGLAL